MSKFEALNCVRTFVPKVRYDQNILLLMLNWFVCGALIILLTRESLNIIKLIYWFRYLYLLDMTVNELFTWSVALLLSPSQKVKNKNNINAEISKLFCPILRCSTSSFFLAIMFGWNFAVNCIQLFSQQQHWQQQQQQW